MDSLENTNLSLIINSCIENLLSKGKLVNAWGLGGLSKANSKPGLSLFLTIR